MRHDNCVGQDALELVTRMNTFELAFLSHANPGCRWARYGKCVCVCLCDGERDTERQRQKEHARERQSVRACLVSPLATLCTHYTGKLQNSFLI